MSRNKEVPGNSIASQHAFDREKINVGIKIGRVDKYLDAYAEEDVYISGLSCKFPMDIGEDYFVVIRAVNAEGNVVAFSNGATFEEAIIGMINRLQNRSLKWKVDKYAK